MGRARVGRKRREIRRANRRGGVRGRRGPSCCFHWNEKGDKKEGGEKEGNEEKGGRGERRKRDL